jgi:Phage portal protein
VNNNMNIFSRLRAAAWNLFRDRNTIEESRMVPGAVYSTPQHRPRFKYGNDRSIVGAVYNRIATDVSVVDIRHVRTDENDTFVETIKSGLNSCLSLEANIDQTNQAFIADVVMSMLDEGVVAIVPIDTSVSLTANNSFDVLSMRTARIVQWYPKHVRVHVYNDTSGEKEEITLPKTRVAIIENPFYSVINERNSTAQRLISKLNLVDAIDEQSGSGKLDLIIQLPYVVKTDTRKKQAEARRKDLEDQLKDSKYGVAYADGTEKVIQLNRPVENNLMLQIEYLTRMLYGQLGISEAILNGTADEKELLNYNNRIISPITSAISKELKRKFITKTAQTQGQTIMAFHNLFSMVTPERLADLSDKLTRNEIASPNDMRSVIGWKPSKAPGADELRNRNLNQSEPTNQEPNINVTKEFDTVKK